MAGQALRAEGELTGQIQRLVPESGRMVISQLPDIGLSNLEVGTDADGAFLSCEVNSGETLPQVKVRTASGRWIKATWTKLARSSRYQTSRVARWVSEEARVRLFAEPERDRRPMIRELVISRHGQRKR